MEQPVINYTTGLPNISRENRVKMMLEPKKPKLSQTLMNRILSSKWLGSNTQALPVGSMKKTTVVQKTRKGGKRRNLTNYNKRALAMLSERSKEIAKYDLKLLNGMNKSVLTKAYNKTRRLKKKL